MLKLKKRIMAERIISKVRIIRTKEKLSDSRKIYINAENVSVSPMGQDKYWKQYHQTRNEETLAQKEKENQKNL